MFASIDHPTDTKEQSGQSLGLFQSLPDTGRNKVGDKEVFSKDAFFMYTDTLTYLPLFLLLLTLPPLDLLFRRGSLCD